MDASRVWKRGLAFYGGLIGGFLALLAFVRRKRLSVPCTGRPGRPRLRPLAR